MKDRGPWVTEATLRGLLLATASGVAATLALALAPLWQGTGPIELPVPFLEWVDWRFVGVPAVFVLVHVVMGAIRWPWPALGLPAVALLAAAGAHFQASAVLDLITQLPGSAPGQRVDIVRTLLTGLSLLLALWGALERGHQRLRILARGAGMPPEALRELRRIADAQARDILAFAGAAMVALTLVANVGDSLGGAAEAPLPEVLGAAIAVGVAVLLFPGLGRKLVRARG